ncbi:MAG: PilN domain-containing protein [Pseudomonadota bacterium]
MSQYINLVNPALRRRRDPLSARTLALAAGAALVLVSGAAAWSGRRAAGLEAESSRMAAQVKQEQEKLAALTKAVSERKPDPRLALELAKADTALKVRQELVKMLEGGKVGRTEGFAEHLRAFARQTTDGLWLTGFTLAAGGNDMEITGKAVDAKMLPAYLRRLNGEGVFSGRSFAALDVRAVREASVKASAAAEALPPHVEFRLSSKAAAADSGGRQ